jgi:hypothetical protein
MPKLSRIILHWTAGGNTANGTDKRAYHYIIDIANGRPRVVAGYLPPEANERIPSGAKAGVDYAAHTRGTNTGSIGVAVAGMRSARERPFDAGPSPMTEAQIEQLCVFVADLATLHKIPCTPRTILTHAEVEQTLGVKQRNKWDIMWLPGMNATADPIAVGNILRGRIKNKMAQQPRGADGKPTVSPQNTRNVGIFAAIAAAVAALIAMLR